MSSHQPVEMIGEQLTLTAYHFEPTALQETNFLDSQGDLLLEPSYAVEVAPEQAEVIGDLLVGFPSELDFGWMCAPIYRDVLVGRGSDGQVHRVFQLCFECDHYLFSAGIAETVVAETTDTTYGRRVEQFRTLFDGFDKEAVYTRSNPLILPI